MTHGRSLAALETQNRVVHPEPRRLQCVRRTTRGQRGRTEESEPQTARSRPVRSQKAEHPGTQLQHVSTAPSPRAACLSSLSRAFLSALCLRSSGYAPRRPPCICGSLPEHAEPHPPRAKLPKSPLPKLHDLDPLGGREKPRHKGFLFLRTQESRPQVGWAGTEGVNPTGKPGVPGLEADPGASFLPVKGCVCCGGG